MISQTKTMETCNKKGYIYLIKQDEFLKIGFTKNLSKRIKAYETHSHDCKIHSCIYGEASIEKNLHKLFEKYKYKNEWFYENDEIYNYFLKNGERFFLENNFININKDELAEYALKLTSLIEAKFFFFCISICFVENKCLIFNTKDILFENGLRNKFNLNKQNLHRVMKSLSGKEFIEKVDKYKYKINPKIVCYVDKQNKKKEFYK